MARTRRADTDQPGISRVGRGLGFSFHDEDGEVIGDDETLGRVRALAVPPAWKDVWICSDPRGHVQATGYDEAGRKQYIYHDDWRASRDRVKFDEMCDFARTLPALRVRLDEGLRSRGLVLERVCACAVRLLDLGLFRVGSERYENENQSYGLTTLKRKHVKLGRGEAVFAYPGKGGKDVTQRISDRAVLPTVRALRKRTSGRSSNLLVYRDGRRWLELDSEQVNAYVKQTSGEGFSAKDFRTWNATVLAAATIAKTGRLATTKADRKRIANLAVRETAVYLNNTPAVCRASYIDPRVFDRFDAGETIAPALERLEDRADPGEFVDRERIEQAVLKLLA